MRPVMRDPQVCSLRELRDGTYSLNDLADMQEAMDEQDEYQRRFQDAAEAKRKSDQGR